jgi:peptidoglycan hydrolase-like protein with peptidoglycan-binding domain
MKLSRIIGSSALALTLAVGGSVVTGTAARAVEANSTSTAANSSSATISPTVWHQMAAVGKTDLLNAQRKLKQDGDYKGPIDGKGGAKTIEAIQQFQKKNGLTPSGWLDEATWNKLGIHPTVADASSTPHATKAAASTTK